MRRDRAQEALGQLATVKAELAAAQQAQATLAKALQAAWAREEAAEQGTPHPDDAPKGVAGAGEVGVAEAGTLAAVLESAEGGDATMVRRRNDHHASRCFEHCGCAQGLRLAAQLEETAAVKDQLAALELELAAALADG